MKKLLMFIALTVVIVGLLISSIRYKQAVEYAESVEYLKTIAELNIHESIPHRIGIDDGEYTLYLVKNDEVKGGDLIGYPTTKGRSYRGTRSRYRE